MEFLKTILTDYSNDAVKVYMVDGAHIRDYIAIDFTEGDNDAHNPAFVPAGEIWIDLDVAPNEVRCTILHELVERRLMLTKNMEYSSAHEGANQVEQNARNNRDQLDELVMAELKQSPAYNKSINQVEAKMATKTLFKTFRCEVKSADPATGIVDMLIPMSTDSEDRMQESISWDAWTKRLPVFLKRPILVSSHDYSDIRKQIGEFISLVPTKDGLMGKPKYYINQGNDEADWAFNIASKGMAAFSVGFIPYEFIQGKTKDEPSLQYTDCELLEISQVVVPCNRDAIQAQRSKSVDPVVNKLMDDILASKDLVKKTISQAEIKDEIDYLNEMVKEVGISDENKELIRRITGNDIPVQIKCNAAKLIDALGACQKAMDCMNQHDIAHQTAFKIHSESIIRCYNGLKTMSEDTPEDGNNQPLQESINIDDIVTNITSKY